MDFSYAGYRRIMRHAKQLGPVIPLGQWTGDPAIILRHDIDLDILLALRLARIEAEEGVRSTYFVLLTHHAYNPLARANREALREMRDMGFEIGLHFDPMAHPDLTGEALEEAARREARILSEACDAEVRSISLHNPSVYGGTPMIQGFRNAYDPSIFAPDRYLSDSRMTFARDIFAFLTESRGKTIQLLLHPLQYSADGLGYNDILADAVQRLAETLDTGFQVNSTYVRGRQTDLFTYVRTRTTR